MLRLGNITSLLFVTPPNHRKTVTKYDYQTFLTARVPVCSSSNFLILVSYQHDALEEADDLDADVELIKTRLASYQLKKTWF